MSQQIHFVHETKPGTALDSSQVRALRSHVRKVNLERSNQKSTRRLENFRSLTITDFSDGGKAKGNKKKQPLESNATASLETAIEDLPSAESPIQGFPLDLSGPPTPSRAFQFQSSPIAESPPRRCSCHRANSSKQRSGSLNQYPSPVASPLGDKTHSFASRIAELVDFDVERIDYLLKSCAFQVAAEPLLSSAAIDKDLASLSVFPECLSNPAFLYALLYSILHIHNLCNATNESLFLKTKAIEYLRADLHEDDLNVRVLSIGAMLLLSSVAYHCGDIAESAAHSEGLYRLLEHCQADGIRLRAEVLRTIFWQHLLGSALVRDQHRFPRSDLQYLLHDHQELPIGALPTIPFGFALHEEVISDDVLLCIRTILKLQDITRLNESDFTVIEELQARIEARLVFHEQCCKEVGPIAECCRVAVYIVSYMTNAATWKSSFVPLRLAEKLLSYLERISTRDLWRYRRDLFLWLLLVGASAGRGENCFGVDAATRYQDFIEATTQDVKNWKDVRNGPKTMQNTIKSFIYPEDWVARRHSIPSWTDLENAVVLCSFKDVQIEVDVDPLLQDPTPETSLFEAFGPIITEDA
ncbi:hypothetical protein H2200_012093 [Cladophialophora chaetospira]|uniref:Transcription factor domain-containing protein n=1 Tax=Cladophialophora chaetospira TaxID=386627 RepID=A0AA38WY67_9EURO|nr:hypothetical protein H2200_012093 [Cladophialophora chaetospira]